MRFGLEVLTSGRFETHRWRLESLMALGVTCSFGVSAMSLKGIGSLLWDRLNGERLPTRGPIP